MKNEAHLKYLLLFLMILSFCLPKLCVAAPKPIIPEHNIYFLSPHFDDVPLTFGGLILNKTFVGKNNNVINIFGLSSYTTNGPAGGKSDARINYVTNMRIAEDRVALSQLFCGWQNYKYTILGERENTVRFFKGNKNAGGGPSGDFTNFRPIEITTFNNIYNEVIPILKQNNCAVFVLSAIQSHIDHFIIREAVIKAVHDLGDQAVCQIYFGEDQPYAGDNSQIADRDIKTLTSRLHLEPITYDIDINKKIGSFVNNYYSQYEDSYVTSLLARARLLGNKERIYRWSKKYYKLAPADPSCKKSYCAFK